jgi:hypothetical protein
VLYGGKPPGHRWCAIRNSNPEPLIKREQRSPPSALYQELGVELGCGKITEGRHDVEPDQVVVPLPGGVLELGHLEPLLDGLPDREPCPWMCLLVDLALEPGERDLGLRVAVRSLLEVAILPGQRVDTDVTDRPVAA